MANIVAGLCCAAAQAMPVRGLLVQLKPVDASAQFGSREAEQAARQRLAVVAREAGLSVREQRFVGGAGYQLLRLATPPSDAELDAMLRRLRLHPEVAAVEVDELLQRADTQPLDPYYATRQWPLKTPAVGGAAAVNLPPAWDLGTGSGAITVAVLDTGVRFDHPDLLPVAQGGRLLPGYDFASEVEFANDGDGRDPDPSDPGDWVTTTEASGPVFKGCTPTDSSWHGTFIAGEIGALTNNNLGVAGVTWGNPVLPVRVAGKCGAFLSDVIDGMRWAAGLPVAGVPANPTPARVLNLSFTGGAPCQPVDGSASIYQKTIDELTAAGALLVVAAGNANSRPMRPADCRNVLTVGAVQQDGLKTSYSNDGPEVALMAPGGSGYAGSPTLIFSTTNLGTTVPGTNDYGGKMGTSFSAPLGTGVAALMLSLNPAIGPLELVSRLRAAARPHVNVTSAPTCSLQSPTTLACNCTTATCGAGLLDAAAATQLALAPVAIIAPVANVTAGAQITLDGRASAAVAGSSIAAYQWSVVSGAPVTITGADQALATATLPVGGRWVFRLRVTDALGRQGEATVSATATAPSPSGGGGGATGPLWGLGLWLLAAWAGWRRQRDAG